jgi:hypothetical protein
MLNKMLFGILYFFLILIFSDIFQIKAQEKSNPSINSIVQKDEEPEWEPNSSEPNNEKVDSYSVKTKKNNITDFFVLGATIGNPAGMNLMAGYYWKDLVIRGSGGYWNKEWWGGQLDLGYSFFKTPVIAHSVSISIGSYGVNPYRPEPGRGGQSTLPGAVDFPGYSNRPATFEDNIIRSYIASYDPNLSAILEYQSRDTQKFYFTQRYIGLSYDILLGNFFLQLGAGSGTGDFKNPVLLMQFGYLFDFRSENK